MTTLPARFGPYELLQPISRGGMAEVFRARIVRERAFSKVVAIKRILPTLGDDDRFVEMFVEEARLVANLNHSNIVQVFDFGNIEGSYYLAMELVDGWDLNRILKTVRSRELMIPVPIAVSIGMGVCNALAYAHQRCDTAGRPLGIVHRDVSPHNILISFEGEVKLSDFGIARWQARLIHTTKGILKGKMGYLSPEQVTQAGVVDARSDLFSLGIVLHEMLSGRRLFVAATQAEVIERVLREKLVPPSRFNPEVSRELDGVVMRALQRNPVERHQSAESMYRDLQPCAREAGSMLTPGDIGGWLRELAIEPTQPSRPFTDSMIVGESLEDTVPPWETGGPPPEPGYAELPPDRRPTQPDHPAVRLDGWGEASHGHEVPEPPEEALAEDAGEEARPIGAVASQPAGPERVLLAPARAGFKADEELPTRIAVRYRKELDATVPQAPPDLPAAPPPRVALVTWIAVVLLGAALAITLFLIFFS